MVVLSEVPQQVGVRRLVLLLGRVQGMGRGEAGPRMPQEGAHDPLNRVGDGRQGVGADVVGSVSRDRQEKLESLALVPCDPLATSIGLVVQSLRNICVRQDR